MSCYDNGGVATGAGGAGSAGCYLAVTGDAGGPMQSIGLLLLGLTAIFVGVLLFQLVKRGTRLPFLRFAFPQPANDIPVSPAGGRHAYYRKPGRHRAE